MRGIPGFGMPGGHQAGDAIDKGCGTSRVAAVSDGEILARAASRKHSVAFFAIDGPLSPGARTSRSIEEIAEAIFGVDKGSIRVSREAAALSLAFDPRRATFAAIERMLDRKLAAMRLSLLPIRIID